MDASAMTAAASADELRHLSLTLPVMSTKDQSPPPWTVMVRTMTGAEIAVPCLNAALTTIADIKRSLSAHNRHWAPERQCLMRAIINTDHNGELSSPPISAASSSSCASSSQIVSEPLQQDHSPLVDHRTLADCGLGDGCALELLVQVRQLSTKVRFH